MTDLVEHAEQIAFMPEVQFSETGLEMPRALTFERWQSLGETLGRINRASGWWIGDWLNFGERAYGESYSQAMDATGLSYGTLANYASVAKRVESSRRRESLTFAHHQEVAALPAREQDEYLQQAEREGLSKAKLRRVVQGETAVAEPERCESCGQPLPKDYPATSNGPVPAVVLSEAGFRGPDPKVKR